MDDRFKERLARLEAKHGPATPPPPQRPAAPSGSGGRGRGPSRTPMLKLVLIGAAVIIGLPTIAVIGTIYGSKYLAGAASLAENAEFLNIALGATDDPERKKARSDMNGIMLRFNTGTMTKEEGEYLASPEGQMKMVEMTRTSLNLEGLEAAGRTKYGLD